MREILFRGIDEGTNEWVYGYYYESQKTSDFGGERRYYIFDDKTISKYNVLPDTVGQYTGLTDKNGKKIFEGDICRNTKTGEIVSVVWHGTMAGYVWSRRKEGCKHLFDFGELFRCFDKYEVIGNVHDNPELLKGGE